MATTPSYETLKQIAFEQIDQLREPMIELSDRIGQNPELGFEEHQAVAWISAVFEEMGFAIECPFVDLPTAFRGRLVGEADGPNVGFLIEYDALPDLGHACGHNTKGSSTWGAVAGILAALPRLPGTITVIGTPAEEGGGGKVLMADRGAFDDLDVALALTVGPTSMTGLASLAVQGLGMRFWGRAAHANARPQDGRNALKACILTFNLVDAMRQQFSSDVRVNGIITDGGQSAGIIPERAAARFNVGCLDYGQQRALFTQVQGCATAASQSSGCEVAFEPGILYREMNLNPSLIALIETKMREVGLEVTPPGFQGGTGGTDVGNVSQITPADSVWIAMGEHLMPHTPEYREACMSEPGHEAIVNGARVGALLGLELFTRPEALAKIRRDFESR